MFATVYSLTLIHYVLLRSQYLVSYGDPICTNMLQGQYGGLESCTCKSHARLLFRLLITSDTFPSSHSLHYFNSLCRIALFLIYIRIFSHASVPPRTLIQRDHISALHASSPPCFYPPAPVYTPTDSFNETLVSTSVSVTANVPVHPAFRALFDGCPAPDPIGATINNVASQFSAVPYQIVSHEINDPSSIFGDSGTSLRPAVANILITATNTTTAALLTAVAQEAAGPFGCSSISAAIEDVHDAVCCNVLAPLYAYVAAWCVRLVKCCMYT